MKVIMIRHLATSWNQRGQLQGSQDIAISDVSADLQQHCRHQLQQLENQYGLFEQVFVSELLRTQQTATVYGIENPSIEPLLNELNFGAYEGLQKTQLIADHADLWFDNPEAIILGEPVAALKTRINAFFEKYHQLSRVLIFGHGNWIRGAMSVAQCGNLTQLNKVELTNNQVIELEWGELVKKQEQIGG